MSDTPFQNVVVVKKLDAPNSKAVQMVFSNVAHWCEMAAVKLTVWEAAADYNFDEWRKVPGLLVVAIGGDGTVIQASKLAIQLKAPVIGFNLGKVGFLSDFDPKNVYQSMSAASLGELKRDQRGTLAAGVDDNLIGTCLNDIVISCAQSDTSFSYDLLVNGAFAGTHVANGVIFSTATGSTAYALAVGGAIIMPELSDIMQVVPIAPQTMTSRPLIVSSDPGSAIMFHVTKERPITVRIDGQIAHTFTNETDEPQYHRVEVQSGIDSVQLLHHGNWNHFETLTKKLGWNK